MGRVLDGADVPVAVIETTELTQRRFDEVDAAFAVDEGEGDRTLASWRRVHQNYFGRQGTFIAKAGKPVASLGPLVSSRPRRCLGILAGKLPVPKDFDTPLPDEVVDAFEGR